MASGIVLHHRPTLPMRCSCAWSGCAARESDAIAAAAQHLDTSFCIAIRLLESCTGSIVVTGVGKAGLVARKISATLASTGTPSHFLHPTEAMHGDLGTLRRDDVLLALYRSQERRKRLHDSCHM